MKNIAIIGLGIIGGSFAKGIQAIAGNDYYVMGIDRDEDTLKEALALGVIAEGETTNESILQKADLVIIALYPTLIKPFIETHRDEFKQDAVITETSGIKQTLIDDILPLIPEQVDFILGHPMAGRESKGFSYSDHNVFKKANYILTPHPGNKEENLNKVTEFIKQLGFGRVTISSPKIHDEMIAYTSQLCHIIATALINSDLSEGDSVEFIGDSFRELTRIAKMNDALWSELMLNNRAALIEVIESFENKFDVLKTAIINEDKQRLEDEFIESTHRREQLEKFDLN